MEAMDISGGLVKQNIGRGDLGYFREIPMLFGV